MKCPNCMLSLIDEEVETHECVKAKGVRIEGSIVWLSDGIVEYPLKLNKVKEKLRTNRNFTPDFSTGDFTEPFT